MAIIKRFSIGDKVKIGGVLSVYNGVLTSFEGYIGRIVDKKRKNNILRYGVYLEEFKDIFWFIVTDINKC